MKKRKWSKPECQRVKLVPEEAVLWGCKIVSGPIARLGWGGSCVVIFGSCVTTQS
ncbi:hypothetical protein BMS3Bbin06_01732 [bacterium BMS3Bbin06]|nr:hypothetical protein BMS3Abin08_01945 [bacterium BMS3Abin08]GBE35194.1 hypothetical protein BMS3Bbin06_01732 [bacterium BMS3Bbin06]